MDTARFTINGTPSNDANGDRIFIATNGQTLTMALETTPSAALSVLFEVFDPADPESPLASKNAPLLTWNENSLPAYLLPLITDTATIDMPGAGIHSYLIRCTVSTASGPEVFERLVVIFSTSTTPPIRKTIPAESTEARARSWADAWDDLVDALDGLVVGGASSLLTSNPGQYTVPAGVAVGDLIYATGTDTADVADNTAVGTMPVMGVVTAKPTATTATVAYLGAVGGFAGMTPGAPQFAGTTGARIEAGALPTSPGSVIQQVGVAISATVMVFDPQNQVEL